MSWVPLESNPEVMTKLLHKIGVPQEWSIVDVYGLEPDLLALVPKPVLAVILLYPDNKKTEPKKEGEEEVSDSNEDPAIYHVKQYIPNACGTVALIHSVANNLDRITLNDGFLKKFIDDTKHLSFTERGEMLVKAHDISDVHMELAQEGQTKAPSENAAVYHHFVAFVHINGALYELDGRKPAPIDHGPTSPDTLLEDAALVCKDYMARDPEEMSFTIVALAAND